MKHLLSIYYLTFIVSLGAVAQVCTPTGTSIDYYDYPSGSAPEIATWEAQAASWISNNISGDQYVNKLDDADGSYNCHGYAWHVEHGGNNEWVAAFLTSDINNFNWYNSGSTPPSPDNIENYWDDGSYEEVLSESEADKVWYGSCWSWNSGLGEWENWCDHSAVTTSTAGRYISKWGKWPLYEHDYNACPYTSNQREYYEFALEVTNEFLLCSTNKSVTLTNSPSGTITWSTSPSNLTYPSSGSGNPASIRQATSIRTGYCTLTFTLSTCGNASYTIESDQFWVGKFESTVVTGTAPVCHNSLYVYTAHPPGGHSSSYSYSWTYPSGWYYYSQWTSNIHLQTPILSSNMTYGPVRASITNECGASGYSGITTYPAYDCGGYYMVSPNPGSEYLELDFAEDEENNLKASRADVELFVTIFDKVGIAKQSCDVRNLPHRFDTSKLPNGNYIINIVDKDHIESIQVIVSH